MYALFKKEVNGFLNSLIGYIVIIVFFSSDWPVSLGCTNAV